jgi:hypothetical protein
MRINGVEGAEFAIQKTRHQVAEETFIAGKTHLLILYLPNCKQAAEESKLSAFPRAIDTFESDELSARRHLSGAQSSIETALGQNAELILMTCEVVALFRGIRAFHAHSQYNS